MANPSTTALGSYDPERHLAAVCTLWGECLGSEWPMEPGLLRRFTTEHPWYRPGDHFVAEDRGGVVGFVATQIHRGNVAPSTTGGIGLILVAPERQGAGIGTRLLSRALEHLRTKGVSRVEIGGGGGTWRFWPGIPPSLSTATGFFERAGFSPLDPSFDLILDLRSATATPDLQSRLLAARLRTSFSSPSDERQLLEFERRNFLPWTEYYQDAFRVGDHRDILIVQDSESAIVGALLLFDRRSRHIGAQVAWQGLLGKDMGGLAGVGVDDERRGGGIGSILVSAGSEILKERGIGICYIEWTYRVDFYRRIGFTLWQEYTMLAKELQA